MSSKNHSERVITQFYHTLDDDVASSLTDKQKREIESAVKSMGLVARHSIDIRETFPWFGRRFYFVLLCGRDRRQTIRERSAIGNLILTSVIMFGALAICLLALLALYLIKSALGIDIFKGFSLGIWDWFKGLFM